MRVLVATLVMLFCATCPLVHVADAYAGTDNVRFYGQDKTTLYYEAHVDDGQSLADAQVEPDVLATEGDSQVPVLRNLGNYFVGWSRASGALFSMDEPVTEDLSLYPAYGQLAVDVSAAPGASADVSQAFLLRSDMDQASDVAVKVEAAPAAEDALRSGVEADGNEVLSCYRVSFGFSHGAETTYVKKGFGLVALRLPVSGAEKTKVKGYWLASDGSVRHSATKSVSDGTVMLNWSDCEVGDLANVVIARVSETADQDAEPQSPEAGAGKAQQDASKAADGKKSGQSKASKSKGGTKKGKGTGSSKAKAKKTGTESSSAKTGSSKKSASGGSSGSKAATPGRTSVRTQSNSPAPSKHAGEKRAEDPDAVAGGGDESSDEPTSAVLDSLGIDGPDSGTYSGDDALDSTARTLGDGGSRDGGVLYAMSMLVIAALACAAWWLAFRRKSADESAVPDAIDS